MPSRCLGPSLSRKCRADERVPRFDQPRRLHLNRKIEGLLKRKRPFASVIGHPYYHCRQTHHVKGFQGRQASSTKMFADRILRTPSGHIICCVCCCSFPHIPCHIARRTAPAQPSQKKKRIEDAVLTELFKCRVFNFTLKRWNFTKRIYFLTNPKPKRIGCELNCTDEKEFSERIV